MGNEPLRPVPLSAAGEQRVRRVQRIHAARGWLHFASGFGLLFAGLSLVYGPPLGIAISFGLAAVFQLTRFLLKLGLPPRPPKAHISDVDRPNPA